MTDLLFIQGAGQDVHAKWDLALVESLRHALGPDFEVRYPRMPSESEPRLATWKPAIAKELAALPNGSVVVGHSVGGTILIDALAESDRTAGLDAIVLIAAPFVGEGGWPSEDGLPRPTLADRLSSGVPVILYHGEEDAIVPVAHVYLYARAIPWARVRMLAGHDHQLNSDLSPVARDIRSLESRRTGT